MKVSKPSCSESVGPGNQGSSVHGGDSPGTRLRYLLFSRINLNNKKGNIQGFLLTCCTLLLHTPLLHLFITEVSKPDPDPSASKSWDYNTGSNTAVSYAHVTIWFGGDLWRSPCPNSWSKQGYSRGQLWSYTALLRALTVKLFSYWGGWL